MTDLSGPLFSPALDSVDVCSMCDEQFIVPVDVLGVAGHWRYVVELHCTNCGWSGVQVHDEAALERLDRALDTQTREMRAAIDVLGVSQDLDRIDRFARALAEGDVLPEDF